MSKSQITHHEGASVSTRAGGAVPATITAYRDGPLIARGAFELRDESGRPIETSRRAVALCRCGKSRIRPFCDGTHRIIGFRASGGLRQAAQQAVGPA